MKIMNNNNFCDILFNDFESAVKIGLYQKSESWIESTYSYLNKHMKDVLFTKEDVIVSILDHIHSIKVVKEYTNRGKT